MAYDEDLANRIRELIAAEPGLTEKKMFGGLAFLIDGNMSVSASREGGLLLRVDPDETDALLGKPHAAPFVMRGREMQGWMRVAPLRRDVGITEAPLERARLVDRAAAAKPVDRLAHLGRGRRGMRRRQA
jgi:TfoX/Sxy family transcriptional regulator of competence genes